MKGSKALLKCFKIRKILILEKQEVKRLILKHATLISEDDNSSHAVQTVVKGATLNIFITPIDPIVLCHMQGDEST